MNRMLANNDIRSMGSDCAHSSLCAYFKDTAYFADILAVLWIW